MIPVVTVITPVYNAEAYLKNLLHSVVSQIGVSVEHVLINDGSTDGSLIILRDWERRFPSVVKVLTRENRGQYASMNDGLAMASGDLILFLCADDRLAFPDSLAKAKTAWQHSRKPDVIHGRWRIIDHAGQLLSGPVLTGPLPRKVVRYVYLISHCAMLIRRDALLSSGIRFDSTLHTTGDFDFILQLIEQDFSFRFTRAVVADYRLHGNQASRTSDQVRHHLEISTLRRRYNLSPVLCWLGGSIRKGLLGAASVLRYVKRNEYRSCRYDQPCRTGQRKES